MNTETKNSPVKSIRVGSVECAIFENQSKKGPFPSASFSRSFKSDGTWKSTHGFNAHHLADLKRVVSEAETYMKDHYK